MDKKQYDAYSSIIASFDEIELQDYFEEKHGVISFKYKGKQFFMFIQVNQNQMPDVFTNYKQDYPHYLTADKNGLRDVCLFDNTEQINFQIPLEDKIRLVIQKLLSLENLNPKGIAKEYLKEFPIYWNRVCEKDEYIYQLFLSKDINYEWLNPRFYKYGNRRLLRFCSNGLLFNDESNKINLNHSKSIFLRIINFDNILPPLNGNKWNVSTILDIIANPQIERITPDAYDIISSTSYSEKYITIIFEINGFYIACDLEFKNKGTAKLINKIRNETIKITHRKISRCDIAYLSRRIGNDNMLNNMKILLIGCGSLGSYVAEELVNCGCVNLTIYDDDNFDYENTFRHKLGTYWHGFNKAKILEYELNEKHPQVNVKAFPHMFNADVNIEKYDLIVSTVGSSDTQFEFNKVFAEKFIDKPVIYAWLEGDGRSSHALCAFNNNHGCYNCCFTNDNGESCQNKYNFSNPQDTHFLTNCCGGVRVAYGSSTLLSASLITLKAVKDAFSTEDQNAFIYHFVGNRVIKDTNVLAERCVVCNDN